MSGRRLPTAKRQKLPTVIDSTGTGKPKKVAARLSKPKLKDPPPTTSESNPLVQVTLEQLEQDTRDWHLARRVLHGATGTSLRSFTLTYNECTISAIARWIENKNPSLQSTDASDIVRCVPVQDVKFRRCCICKKWGHYEVKCPEATTEQWKRQALAAHHKEIKSKTAGIEQEIFIEECDGFVIEQRSEYPGPPQRKRRGGSRHSRGSGQASIGPSVKEVKTGSFLIQAAESAHALVNYELSCRNYFGSARLCATWIERGDTVGWFSSDPETAAAAGENVLSGTGQENVDGRPSLFRGVVSAKQMNESQLVVHGVRKVNLSPEGVEALGSMTATEEQQTPSFMSTVVVPVTKAFLVETREESKRKRRKMARKNSTDEAEIVHNLLNKTTPTSGEAEPKPPGCLKSETA